MATITIADDNKSILVLLKEIVTIAGHEVLASSNNGMDALKHYFEYKPDITILDNKMPHLNGIHVAQHILQKNAAAKIILCTANHEEIHGLAAKLGLTLIHKPFTPEIIVQSIELILKDEN